jgi:alpha-ribazole phosphatase
MELYLIRHTSVAVPKGICYGATDTPLNDTFEAEAEAVKTRLEGIAFDAVFTSPLSRAVRLAAYCGYPGAEKDDRIRELDFGEWEMKSFDELYKNDQRFREWCEGDYVNLSAPGGESLARQMERFVRFAEEKKEQGHQRIAAFCHGGILACGLIMSGQATRENALAAVPPYGSIVRLTI